MLRTKLQLGSVTLRVQDASGNDVEVKKVSAFKRKKPESWRDSHFFVEIPSATCSLVVEGLAEGSELHINDEIVGNGTHRLPKATNGIHGIIDGVPVDIFLHVVVLSEDLNRSRVQEVCYDEDEDFFFFDEISFWMMWMLVGDYYDEGYADYQDTLVLDGWENEVVQQEQEFANFHDAPTEEVQAVSEEEFAEQVDQQEPETVAQPDPEPERHYSPPEPTYEPPPPDPEPDRHSSFDTGSSYDGGGYDGGSSYDSGGSFDSGGFD